MNVVPAQEPRVSIVVVLFFLRGALNFLSSGWMLADYQENPSLYYDWVPLYGLGGILIAVVGMIAAILILRHKRIGLIIGGVILLLELLLATALWLATSLTPNPIGMVITLIILYIVYRYLTHEPEKTFFT